MELATLTAEQTERFRSLLRDLDSFRKQRRISAGRVIRSMPADLLLLLAEMESRNVRLRSRIASYCSVALFVGFPFWLWATCYGSDWRKFAAIFSLVGPACLAVSSALYVFLPFRANKAMAAIISEQEDGRFVWYALKRLANSDFRTNNRGSVCATLCRLLPRLRADQGAVLTPEQRRLLLVPLKSPWRNRALIVATLKGLEQVGGEWAIPAVQELTSYQYAPNRTVGTAALECLTFLEQRAAHSKEMMTLLRASSPANAFTPDVLVRPSVGPASSTAPEQLLRAHFE